MKNLIKNILKEETENLDKGLLNYLRRRVNLETKDLSFGDGKPLIIKTASFNIGGDWYNIKDNEYVRRK